ncbi:MAG TPA: hypothetical protein VL400_19505, partial [Polyangiaceae bacterium]|nr:hypothetical protein [Polyangiaceae bacterium]
PRDLSQYRRDVPPAMRDIVLRCLQKDRGQRYPDVAALATALAPFAHARAATSVSRVMAVSGRTSQPTPMPTQAGAGPTTPGMPQITGFDSLPPGTSPTVHGVSSSSGPIAPAPTKIDGATMEGLPPPSVAMRPSSMSATAASQSWAGTMASTAPRASRMPLFVGVGALAIAALAGGGFVLMQSRKGDAPKTSAVVIDAKTTAGPIAAADTTTAATASEPNVAPVGTSSAIAPVTTSAAAAKPPVGANGKPTGTAAATATATAAPTATAPPTTTSPPSTKPPATTAPTVTKPPAAPDPFDRPD